VREEKTHDDWFNEARPMTRTKQIWREKRLAQEEQGSSEKINTSSDKGSNGMDVNMVFELPAEFRLPEAEVAELALKTKAAIFQKPEKMGLHMNPLFITGYLQE
jgi:hypothetical protein